MFSNFFFGGEALAVLYITKGSLIPKRLRTIDLNTPLIWYAVNILTNLRCAKKKKFENHRFTSITAMLIYHFSGEK